MRTVLPAAGYLSLIIGMGIISTVCVALALMATNPLQIGPLGVTGWFVGLFIALSSWLAIGLVWLSGRLQTEVSLKQRLVPAWRRGLLLGAWLTIILGLSSLDQLGVRDVVLSILLIAIIEFYFRMKK